MRQLRVLTLICTCVLAGGASSLQSAQPSHGAKPLSKWLKLYENAGANSADEAKAKQAIRAIGTNAVTPLLQMLTNADLEIQAAGKNGFEILGPLGAPAVPHLTKLLAVTNQVQRFMAAQALGYIGAPALPALMAGLTNRSYALGTDCALSIVELGTNAKPAIPIFLHDLQHPNHFYRERAADALGKLHIEPDLVVPALTNLLSDPSHAARFLAMQSLGRFGPAARPAVPAIRLFLTDPDLKEAATNALREIAPEVLTNAPPR